MQIGPPSFPTNNVIIPRGGPRVIPAPLDFGNTPQIELDGEQIVNNGGIEYLQGVYIDNADNPTRFELLVQGTSQRIIAAPNTQGYYAILCQNPPHLTAKTTQAGGRVINVHFYNVPIQPQVWKVA